MGFSWDSSESRENQRKVFCRVSAILAAVADREELNRSGENFNPFVEMATADENESELEAALGFIFDGVVLRRGAQPTPEPLQGRLDSLCAAHHQLARAFRGLRGLPREDAAGAAAPLPGPAASE